MPHLTHHVLSKTVTIEISLVNTIIKPKQLKLLRKQLLGQQLNDNEKRYLRGNLGNKLEFLESLWEEIQETNEYQQLLNIIDMYYITGLEALKYHGFGWYYIPKIIEIINTRLDGKIKIKNVTLKFYRVRTIRNSNYLTDKSTGIKYATTEQIVIDTKYTKNEYTKLVWLNMLNRYREQFIEKSYKYDNYIVIKESIDPSEFGV